MSFENACGLSVAPAIIAAAKMAGLKTTDYEGRVSPTWEYIQYSGNGRPLGRAGGVWEGRELLAEIEPLLTQLRDLENPLRQYNSMHDDPRDGGYKEQQLEVHRKRIGEQVKNWIAARYPEVLA